MNNPLWLWKNWSKLSLYISIPLSAALIALSFAAPGSVVSTILFYGNCCLLVGLFYAFIKFESITEDFKQKALNVPILKFIREGNLNAVKALNLSTEELNFEYPDGEDPVGLSVLFNRKDILEYLLGSGASQNKKFKNNILPAVMAMRMGNVTLFSVLQKHEALSSDELETENISPFMVDCFLGDSAKVTSSNKEFLANQKDKWLLTPMLYSFLGNTKPDIIHHLLNLGSDINHKTSSIVQDPKSLALSKKEISPIHLAFEKVNEDVILAMLKKEKKYLKDPGGASVLMKAVEKSMMDIVRYLILILDIAEKDSKGMDAIGYARLTKNVEAERLLREALEIQKNAAQARQVKQTSQDIALGISQHDPNKLTKMEFDDVHLIVQVALRGMVGVEKFSENFAHEVKTFMDDKRASKGIVLWGNSSVGKTEIGKRLSGLKQSIAKPIFPGLKVKYIACCDDDIDVKAIIESTENKTILFLDEIDKYLSPSSGLVSESQAKGLRTSLITNFERKEIFWVFTGTFHDMRGQSNLSRTTLEKTLGSELSSRLDFSDWKLEDWNSETLLKAAVTHLNQDKNVDYQDEALQKLVQYILKHNGGVRGLEKAHESIKRSNRTSIVQNATFVITTGHIDEFIMKENADA